MKVEQLTKELTRIGDAAKKLAEGLKGKAEAKERVTNQQKTALGELVRRTANATEEARTLASADMRRRIKDLGAQIERAEAALSISGLEKSTRDILRARVRNLRAQRVRLNAQLGTDFAGLLTATKAREIEKLLARAKQEVKRKQKAAEAVETAMDMAEIAITIGGKLASAV